MKRNRISISLSTLVLFFLVCSNLYSQIDKRLPFVTGAVETDSASYLSIPVSTTVRGPLKYKVSLKDANHFIPCPGDQGQVGSCTSWAVAFAALTYKMCSAEKYSCTNSSCNNDLDKIFSPAFVHNILSGKKDRGVAISKAMELVKNSGCASWISFPYSDSDWNNLPSEKVRMDALKNRISDYRTVPISAENFKTELNEGYPIVIAFYLDNRFFEIVNAGGKYIWDGILGKEGNINDTACYYHAVTVIGYDEDTRLFEIMNSWGNDWASNGFFFIDYEVLNMKFNRYYSDNSYRIFPVIREAYIMEN